MRASLACHQQPVVAPRATVPRRRFALAFDDADLERQYLDEAFEVEVRPTLDRVLLSLLAAAVGFIAVDRVVVPDVFEFALVLRLGLVVPVWGVAWYLAHLGRLDQRRATTWSAGGTLVVVATFYALGLQADAPGSWFYIAYAAVFPLAGPPLARWTSRLAVLFNGVVLVGAVVTVLVLSADAAVSVYLLVVHVAAATFGVLGGVVVEGFSRDAFLQRRQMQEQQERTRTLVLNILPEEIADRLEREPGFVAEVHDDVTVLFADIVGFTGIVAENGAAAVIGYLDRLFRRFDALAQEHGVEKIKTIGDAYMVAAGLHDPHPTDTARVLRFATAVLAAAHEFGAEIHRPVELRVGVHRGPVVAGVIGTSKFAYDLWGDTVNVASRMESQGEPGRIQVTAAVRRDLGPEFTFEERGRVEVRGRGEMATAWLVGEST